jgi:hypothetical protein
MDLLMPRYRVEFKLNTYAIDTYATDKDEAYDKARELAVQELGYDTMKYAEADIKELTNA